VHHRGEAPLLHEEPVPRSAKAEITSDHKRSTTPHWEWSKTDEMPAADKTRTSHVLDEVGRMEAWMNSVADKVNDVKSNVDVIREDGGVVHLKDS
jgi:hypothetical protein